MTPLIILISTFLICALGLRVSSGRAQYYLSARIAMTVMLCFTAMGHFLFPKGMAMMVPQVIPFKTEIVYLTGVIEIILGIGLVIPVMRILAARSLLVFLILVLPSNIKAAQEHISYNEGNFEGPGLAYLWFRVPLQILFITWIYYSCLHKSAKSV
jgi:uncharacterized membrane protein